MPARTITTTSPTPTPTTAATAATRPSTYRIFRNLWMSLAALGAALLLVPGIVSGETGQFLATATPASSAAVLALAAAAVFAVVAWVLRRATLEDELDRPSAGAAA